MPIDKNNSLIILDIDGTIVPNNTIDVINKDYINMKKIKLHKNIKNFIEYMDKFADIVFITSRNKMEYKEITENLLKILNIKYEIYYYNKQRWIYKEYVLYKLNRIRELLYNYEFIIIIDDVKSILVDIKRNLKTDKLLFFVYAKYNPNINNVQCLEII